MGVLVYFLSVDSRPAAPLQALHYGIFLALTIEEIFYSINKMLSTVSKPERGRTKAYAAGSAQVSGTLILNGFLQVYGVACFGALIAEFSRIRSGRKKLTDLTASDWVLSTFFILTSGVVAALHGVTDVNALTALQLGAAGPLVVKRLR